ncbi:MAG: succinate dehydrogenase, cytochrome b556 subunit [Robiginitomaculum sp.]|nr:MAG: succinate dehydrogenase, cytochrome b556 subunit [Robiginitomaculum sp.]PHQ68212.1 MAG: succinate dehydrogenase, cytochrome b556 subunit [Robiginitomaculum sp.]
MAKGWTDKRPMSPHISIWKWHPTMLSSILHRATGIVLYIGLIKLAVVLAFLAAGPQWFAKVEPFVYSRIGAFAFFFVVGVLVYHFLNGIRHLVWDIGAGFNPKLANMVSLVTILVSAILAAYLTWLLTGAIS